MTSAVGRAFNYIFYYFTSALCYFFNWRELSGWVFFQNVVYKFFQVIQYVLNAGAGFIRRRAPGVSDDSLRRADAFHTYAAICVVPLDRADAVFSGVVDMSGRQHR